MSYSDKRYTEMLESYVANGYSKRELDTFLYYLESRQVKTTSTLQTNLQERAEAFLTKLGIPQKITGFSYLTKALIIAYNDNSMCNLSRLYVVIAQEYDTTVKKVERSIRYAKECVLNNGRADIIEDFYGGFFVQNNTMFFVAVLELFKTECNF